MKVFSLIGKGICFIGLGLMLGLSAGGYVNYFKPFKEEDELEVKEDK